MTKKLQRLMKSPGLRFTVILCVVVAGMVALWEPMPAPTKNEGQRSAMESWLAAVKNSFSLSRYFESAFGRSRIVIIWQLWAIYHAPIHLYGQVIDQYGNPVADADVQAHVATSPTMQSNSGKKIYTKTDASGFFAIEGGAWSFNVCQSGKNWFLPVFWNIHSARKSGIRRELPIWV